MNQILTLTADAFKDTAIGWVAAFFGIILAIAAGIVLALPRLTAAVVAVITALADIKAQMQAMKERQDRQSDKLNEQGQMIHKNAMAITPPTVANEEPQKVEVVNSKSEPVPTIQAEAEAKGRI